MAREVRAPSVNALYVLWWIIGVRRIRQLALNLWERETFEGDPGYYDLDPEEYPNCNLE